MELFHVLRGVVLGEIIETVRFHHLKTDDSIYWHPNRNVPGVEFHSGSLGHLLSVAIGVALDIRLRGGANRVYVILGDGELDEGSIWEACLVASAYRLDNLVAIVDRNEFQANIRTEELVPLEPIPANAGLILPAPGYLEAMRELCTADGTLLIFDEVMQVRYQLRTLPKREPPPAIRGRHPPPQSFPLQTQPP